MRCSAASSLAFSWRSQSALALASFCAPSSICARSSEIVSCAAVRPFFEGVLRAGRGRIGLGKLVALTLGGGELVAQLCILAAEAVALLLERFDLLLTLERGFFDITNDVIAVEAAEDGALEGIFHDFPTFSFVKVMVTQTRRDDKEKSATS